MITEPRVSFFFVLGKGKMGYWVMGGWREGTAAGVAVLVSTGSGSLQLRGKGGFVCFYFIFAFFFTFYLSYLIMF